MTDIPLVLAQRILAIEEKEQRSSEEEKRGLFFSGLTEGERAHPLGRWLEAVKEDLSWYDNLLDAAEALVDIYSA
ncbi:MAG: hypothetical protein QJR00_03670 [Bacillota bacterium]|nr:hypothetical protein [Bacillota bacterium]